MSVYIRINTFIVLKIMDIFFSQWMAEKIMAGKILIFLLKSKDYSR